MHEEEHVQGASAQVLRPASGTTRADSYIEIGFEPSVGELAPGDAVYIPRGTWHHVRTIADSLSVNFWWARGVWLPLVVGVDLFKKLRGISH